MALVMLLYLFLMLWFETKKNAVKKRSTRIPRMKTTAEIKEGGIF
jgi:hypothetical protein